MTLPFQISDKQAMDRIQALLSGQMWSPDTLDEIAEVVAATGREIEEPAEEEEEETS